MMKLSLSENIVRLRHEKKLTQEELADFMGVTKASVSKWEKGINTPDLLLLPQLAAFFDMTVDELIGYEAQLSSEQIRCQYAELTKDFASLPFEAVLEKTRSLAHKYYSCYPFLLQLCVLYWNHYMLGETKEVLKAGLLLQLGKAAEAIEVLEPSADTNRLTGQNAVLLVQAYQAAGEAEKARSYMQAKQYLDLMNLVGDAILTLSLNVNDVKQCEETIRRIKGVMELYHLQDLHPNLAAQFFYQSAVIYGVNGREEEALKALCQFEKCVGKLLMAEQIKLHGDDYFNLLDSWIERLPLGNMTPRDKSFIWQSIQESLAHPAFENIMKRDEFQRLVHRLTEKKDEYTGNVG